MERRGASHIEVILAFLLFISAVTAAIYFFSPAYKSGVAESTIDYAYKAIKDGLQVDLTTYYVAFPEGDPAKVTNPATGTIRIENYGGDIADYSFVDENKLCINTNSNMAVIYASGRIEANHEGANCEPAPGSSSLKATVSSSVKESVISEDKAEKMAEDYESGYEDLKSDLNIPAERDFSFSLNLAGSNIVAEKNIPRGISVYAKSEKLKVIMKDGKREFADLIVKIW